MSSTLKIQTINTGAYHDFFRTSKQPMVLAGRTRTNMSLTISRFHRSSHPYTRRHGASCSISVNKEASGKPTSACRRTSTESCSASWRRLRQMALTVSFRMCFRSSITTASSAISPATDQKHDFRKVFLLLFWIVQSRCLIFSAWSSGSGPFLTYSSDPLPS